MNFASQDETTRWKIEHPILGRLEFVDDCVWIGQIRLPLFGKYDDLEYSDHRRNSDELFNLQIESHDHSKPTELQEAAFIDLIEHEARYLDAALNEIISVYCNWPTYRLDGSASTEFEFSHICTPEELTDLLRIGGVRIGSEVEGRVPITFHFSSTLDVEHGIEIATFDGVVARDYELGVSFPFEVPLGIGLDDVEYEPCGKKFAELFCDGKWNGTFVFDHESQCIGTIQGSAAKAIADPARIEKVRPISGWSRWYLSESRSRLLARTGLLNLLVAAPCFLIGWFNMPILFWAALVISSMRFVAVVTLTNRAFSLISLALPLGSLAGIVYATNAERFGKSEQVDVATGVYGWIIWYGASAAMLAGLFLCFVTLITFDRRSIRDGGLNSVAICFAFVVAMLFSLVATTSWGWSKFNLLWLTPVVAIGSIALAVLSAITVNKRDEIEEGETKD